MNPMVIIVIIYSLVTLGAVSILYFSFKGKVDLSGKYFLLAELLMLLLQVQVAITNLNPNYCQPSILFLGNLFYFSSDLAVFFSIYALNNNVKFKKYILSIFLAALYCILIELVRTNSGLPVAMSGVVSSFTAFATYVACKFNRNSDLKNNLFLKWISYLELLLGLFGLLRVVSFFMGAPVMPRIPTTANILLFSLFAAVGIFRYFAYLSLRISWVDEGANNSNPLNKNLALAFKEKDSLLRGLIASNRVIGISALASSLAHQLSQPLTAIGLQIDTLKRDLTKSDKDEKTLGKLEKVSSQLGKLTALLNNLRQLFNQRGYQSSKVQLQTITDEILEIIEPTLQSNRIHLSKEFNSSPTVLADALQIQQVLINLFNNAIDAVISNNREQREIRLTIDSDEKFAIIRIEDTGAGIDPSKLSSIFELYKTTKTEGIGVGLWLSKTIIDKHHGHITAANSANDGAVFTVKIPLAENN